MIVARVPLIIADILLIYITWTKLSSRDTLRDIQQSKRLSLTDIFFRNGLFYFVCRESRRTLKLTICFLACSGTVYFVYVIATPYQDI